MAISVSWSRSSAMARCAHQAADDAERRRRHALEQRARARPRSPARAAASSSAGTSISASLCISYRPRCASAAERSQNFQGSGGLRYTSPPRRDGGTGRRGGLKIRCPKKACGFDSLSRHHLYLMNFCSNCGTRVVLKVPEGDFLPRHVCDELRDHPLPESQARRRQRARVRGPDPDLQARHRAAAGLLDDPRRVHGKRRDPGSRAPRARPPRKRASTSRSAACCCSPMSRSARQVHVFFRSRMLHARFRRHPREPGGEAGRREARSPGTTSRFRAPSTRCAASSRTGPRASNGTTWPKCSADSGFEPRAE